MLVLTRHRSLQPDQAPPPVLRLSAAAPDEGDEGLGPSTGARL